MRQAVECKADLNILWVWYALWDVRVSHLIEKHREYIWNPLSQARKIHMHIHLPVQNISQCQSTGLRLSTGGERGRGGASSPLLQVKMGNWTYPNHPPPHHSPSHHHHSSSPFSSSSSPSTGVLRVLNENALEGFDTMQSLQSASASQWYTINVCLSVS